jgi:hypothetical protein
MKSKIRVLLHPWTVKECLSMKDNTQQALTTGVGKRCGEFATGKTGGTES